MNTYLDNNNATIPLTIGPAVSLFINPNEWLGFVLSAADAEAKVFRSNLSTTFDSDCKFNAYFETDFRYVHPTKRGPLVGNYRFGLVLDPLEREIYGTGSPPRTDSANLRFYLSFDQQVYVEPDQQGGQGLGLFARYGYQDGNLNFGSNPTEHFWSAGAQYLGPIPQRDRDAIGFAFYSAIGSHPRREVRSGQRQPRQGKRLRTVLPLPAHPGHRAQSRLPIHLPTRCPHHHRRRLGARVPRPIRLIESILEPPGPPLAGGFVEAIIEGAGMDPAPRHSSIRSVPVGFEPHNTNCLEPRKTRAIPRDAVRPAPPADPPSLQSLTERFLPAGC